MAFDFNAGVFVKGWRGLWRCQVLLARWLACLYGRRDLKGARLMSWWPSAHAGVLRGLCCLQENVKRVQLADQYMSGAALAGQSGSSLPENYNAF